jgi:FlaG/FlaF family flagellin (archaellin)
MVAITVILAAVIAAFVLGLGDTNSTTPSVTWEYDYDGSDKVDVTMTGGESFTADRVSVTGSVLASSSDSGELGEGDDLTAATDISSGDTISAGDSFTVDLDDSGTSDEFELEIIFTSEDGGTSGTIGGTTGPDA